MTQVIGGEQMKLLQHFVPLLRWILIPIMYEFLFKINKVSGDLCRFII